MLSYKCCLYPESDTGRPRFPQDVLYGLHINYLPLYLDTNYFRFYFYN